MSRSDSAFFIDAIHIPGTNFVAASGPRARRDMDYVFMNSLFHSDTPITEFVALGACTAYRHGDHQDFADYCLKEDTYSISSLTGATFAVTVKRLSGMTSTTRSGHQTFPQVVVQSQLNVVKQPDSQEKILNVSVAVMGVATAAAVLWGGMKYNKNYHFGGDGGGSGSKNGLFSSVTSSFSKFYDSSKGVVMGKSPSKHTTPG